LFSRNLARVMSVLGITAAVAVAACTEDIDSSAACPLLCPPQSITLRDTTIEGVAFDTTLGGFPGLGLEATMLLSQSPDSLDTRVIVRFDSLPTTFRVGGNDSTITRVDTATLSFRLAVPILTTGPFIIEAYDVDTTATDTLPETLLPLFRPDRLLATETVSPASIPDSTLRIFLDTGAVLRRITSQTRLRIGLRVREGTSGRVSLLSNEGGATPRLQLRVTRDTTVAPLTVGPQSKTTTEPFRASQLVDYVFVARQSPAAPSSVLALGGMRGQRSYLRFDIPAHIADTASVVRATLILTQLPYRGAGAGDTVTVFAHATLGSTVVTDIRRAASLLGGFSPDTLPLVASDSGRRDLELASLVLQWSVVKLDRSLRTIVLRVPTESERPAEARFFSREGPADLRPRLRLIYVPRTTFGQP
jgi:hypothetical protein